MEKAKTEAEEPTQEQESRLAVSYHQSYLLDNWAIILQDLEISSALAIEGVSYKVVRWLYKEHEARRYSDMLRDYIRKGCGPMFSIVLTETEYYKGKKTMIGDCPICKRSGEISTGQSTRKCDRCKGRGVIPL